MFFSLKARFCCRNLNNAAKNKYDLIIIGGGIIGTAVARKFQLECAEQDICLVEKECALGKHQSSHNSGVMHCGVFYKSNSLKANLCVKGTELLQKYCDVKNIPYKKSGKIIIARDLCEVNGLRKLYKQGLDNKVRGLQFLESQDEIRKYSPCCRGEKALWCPETANINFQEVIEQLADDFIHNGGNIALNYKVVDIQQSEDSCFPIYLNVADRPSLFTKYVVICGGLHSEALTNMVDDNFPTKQQFLILKVDYHKIDSKYCENLQTNVYGVPDLELPFLGAHFSPQMNNTILLGPSAVPALKVEGYCNDEVSFSHLSKMLFSCNVRNMVIRNFTQCVNQLCQALNSDVQIKYLQQLIPNFSYQYVIKGPTAVQCQILNSNGTFVDDYIFDFFNGSEIGKRIINLKYTPSPAATSCFSIADYVYEKFTEHNIG